MNEVANLENFVDLIGSRTSESAHSTQNTLTKRENTKRRKRAKVLAKRKCVEEDGCTKIGGLFTYGR